MLKELRFEELYLPEYYFEIPDYDSRLAIMKFRDARDTMGMALFSLSYVVESNEADRIAANIIHLRHAIEDLNNSFDLMLQIPWFFYRIWEKYNSAGSLRKDNLKNRNNIIRNATDWVIKAEKACSKEKVVNYLDNNSNPLKEKIENFGNDYITNSDKDFTVRDLCNRMKHRGSLAFEEQYKKYNFNLRIDGQSAKLWKDGDELECIFDFENENQEIIGQIAYKYTDDLSIDIEYKDGELFRFGDCSHASSLLKITDVFKECCAFYNALVDLFEDIYKVIYPNMILLHDVIGNGSITDAKISDNVIDLKKFFK